MFQAIPRLVLKLISATLPRSRVCMHVLVLELPQLSMYEHIIETIADIMSHLQIRLEKLILGHAWLNL